MATVASATHWLLSALANSSTIGALIELHQLLQTAGALLKMYEAAHMIPEQKQSLLLKGLESSPTETLDPANRFGYETREHVGVILLANGERSLRILIQP